MKRLLLGIVALLTVAAGVAHYADVPAVVAFAIAAAALAGLAWVVSFATEQVGEHYGPAATGVLQSTLGNLPELFVVMFALSKGELVVAQFSILGSIFANALLVLGAVFVVGAHVSPDRCMRFGPRLPNDTATLLLLASFIIVLVAISDRTHDSASSHTGTISAIAAGLLLSVYAGNAVENVAGVVLAAKGQSDLAISVVKNSVAQIAAFLFPLLVLVSLAFAHQLTFGMPPVYVGALLLTAISIWQITSDGRATAFEGWALIATYGVLAVFTLYE